jgi:hypothetical protein
MEIEEIINANGAVNGNVISAMKCCGNCANYHIHGGYEHDTWWCVKLRTFHHHAYCCGSGWDFDGLTAKDRKEKR